MSDLYLSPTNDGGELVLTNGKPQMTSGLDNAVYLTLFTQPWWGNAYSTEDEKYTSKITEIMNSQSLTLQTKNDVVEEAKNCLAWMKDKGIADDIRVNSEIPEPGRLYLAITIDEPDTSETFKYSLNWDAQEVSVI